MIDRFSRWPEAIPLEEISAETISTAFYTHWVARFGAPYTVSTDQGPQFEATLFKALTNLIGCNRIESTCFQWNIRKMASYFEECYYVSRKP